jgi:hypothetical protein
MRLRDIVRRAVQDAAGDRDTALASIEATLVAKIKAALAAGERFELTEEGLLDKLWARTGPEFARPTISRAAADVASLPIPEENHEQAFWEKFDARENPELVLQASAELLRCYELVILDEECDAYRREHDT